MQPCQVFFSAKSITADYVWRDAMNQTFERIELGSPVLEISLDEKGNILDPWAKSPGSGAGDEPLFFPPDGIFIRDGGLTLKTPVGSMEAAIDAQIYSQDEVEGHIQFTQSDLAYEGIKGQFIGGVAFGINKDIIQLDSDLAVRSIADHFEDFEARPRTLGEGLKKGSTDADGIRLLGHGLI